MNRKKRGWSILAISLPRTIFLLFMGTGSSLAELPRGDFWSPTAPPIVKYAIDCKIDYPNGDLEGHVVASFRNSTGRSIELLMIAWPEDPHGNISISVNGETARILGEPADRMASSSFLVQLPSPVEPGHDVSIETDFTVSFRTNAAQLEFRSFHPRVDWGFPTHSEYDVGIDIDSSWTLVCSGLLDPKSGRYHGTSIRDFGIVAAMNGKLLEDNSHDVLIRCLYTPRGEACARILTETAEDVIAHYHERFGFYPQPFLNIVPGMDRPVGGYPFATGLVVVHGQERMSEKPKSHWQWIMAHEIGHQYWMEHVLSGRADFWLMIGLGLYADREYVRTRRIGLDNHNAIVERYLLGIQNRLDTRMDLSANEIKNVDYDYNNVVEHGKSYSFISALSCLLGRETFERAYVRCLEKYRARCLAPEDFQGICEEVSGRDLGNFFEEWLSTSHYLRFKISSQSTARKNGVYESEVHVRCLGTLNMPVPVEAQFDDGTVQRQFTDGVVNESELRFRSTAQMKKATIDPDKNLALINLMTKAPVSNLSMEISGLSYTGSGDKAFDLFPKALEADLADISCWRKLGMTLYDGYHYEEALKAFRIAADLSKKQRDPWLFVYLTWQGHILDLENRREEAINVYKKALVAETGRTMQHNQYGMFINRQWIEKRLKLPLER